jgi:hypothetical protein
MRVHPLVVAVGLCSLLVPSLCVAQNLAEAAAKEKARRKALTPGKTYTVDDLRRAGGPAATSSSAAATDAAAPAGDAASAPKASDAPPSGPKAKTDDELRAEREKDWRDRVAKTNDEISRLNAAISFLEGAVGDLSQNLYGATRTAQLNQLDENRSKLAAAQKTLADLQEEGRRNSYK